MIDRCLLGFFLLAGYFLLLLVGSGEQYRLERYMNLMEVTPEVRLAITLVIFVALSLPLIGIMRIINDRENRP